MHPHLHDGDFVFCTVRQMLEEALMCFRETEGITVILEKHRADQLGLQYTYVSAWITLTVHSSLEAVGLTAAFSQALADAGISCNVVAAFYHDHIFVARPDAEKAMDVLNAMRRF